MPKSDNHLFTGIERSGTKADVRWKCSCGARGHWMDDSYSPGFGWYKHFYSKTGVIQPRGEKYEPWMRQSTEKAHGLRAADVQRAHLDLQECPDEKSYPWGKKKDD